MRSTPPRTQNQWPSRTKFLVQCVVLSNWRAHPNSKSCVLHNYFCFRDGKQQKTKTGRPFIVFVLKQRVGEQVERILGFLQVGTSPFPSPQRTKNRTKSNESRDERRETREERREKREERREKREERREKRKRYHILSHILSHISIYYNILLYIIILCALGTTSECSMALR